MSDEAMAVFRVSRNMEPEGVQLLTGTRKSWDQRHTGNRPRQVGVKLTMYILKYFRNDIFKSIKIRHSLYLINDQVLD